MAEGMNLALADAQNDENRLLVLLKIVHRALVTNCPGLGESGADASIWEKSGELRQTLVEKIAVRLLVEVAACVAEGSANIGQVEDMIKIWEEQDVCDGSVAWGDVREKWEDGLEKKNEETQAVAATSDTKKDLTSKTAESSVDKVKATAGDGQNEKTDVDKQSAEIDSAKQTSEASKNEEAEAESSGNKQEETSSPDDKRRQISRQDSTMSTTSVASVGDIDYEVRFNGVVNYRRFHVSKNSLINIFRNRG